MLMGITDFFRRGANPAPAPTEVETDVQTAVSEKKDSDIFKAYIPDFLYRPPFGMPRKVNTQQLKELGANPYVFSVTKTLGDEATCTPWKIQVKEEFQDEFADGRILVGDAEFSEEDIHKLIKDITKFFKNPNGNEESFQHIQRQLITDLAEVDSAVIVKVFNVEGEFKQMFSRDGSLFLKNPDIYGYMGNRKDFVVPLPNNFSTVKIDFSGTPSPSQNQLMKQYSLLYKDDAAYFQYGWTAGSMPVPFGRREIVYMMQNPRSDSIYGVSPIQRLQQTILNLVYGIDFNLDFYTNNNMPEGAISLLGANRDQIKQARENWENQFRFTDTLGNKRKRFFKHIFSSQEIKFTPFQLDPKQMDILAQQAWFTKLLWMCYGVNADEMGFTEDSNRSTGDSQIKNAKRKAVKPLLDVMAYHFNTQVMTEFFSTDKKTAEFGDIPLEFVYDEYDIEEDMKDLQKLNLELTMGIKTPMMVAKERDIDVEELEAELEKKKEEEMEMMDKQNALPVIPGNPKPDDKKEKKEKPKKEKTVTKSKKLLDIDSHIDEIGKQIINEVEKLYDEDISSE